MVTFKDFLLMESNEKEEMLLDEIQILFKKENDNELKRWGKKLTHMNADTFIYNSSLQNKIFPEVKNKATKEKKMSQLFHSLIKKGKLEIVSEKEFRSSDSKIINFGRGRDGTTQTTYKSILFKLK